MQSAYGASTLSKKKKVKKIKKKKGFADGTTLIQSEFEAPTMNQPIVFSALPPLGNLPPLAPSNLPPVATVKTKTPLKNQNLFDEEDSVNPYATSNSKLYQKPNRAGAIDVIKQQ